MKRFFPFFILAVFSFFFLLSSCSDFGEKINAEGTKGEVYYKDGATESDARKLGNLFKKDGFFGNQKVASVQVVKKNSSYAVRFVYDKAYYEKIPWLDDFFKTYTVRMSQELFDSKRVDIALKDKYFKEFKKIPYDEATAKAPAAPKEETFKSNYTHETVGDVNFYWKDIGNVESKTIVDYISRNGAFSGGTAEIYISKEGNRYILKFPVKEEYRNDAGTIAQVEKVSREIKENVFADDLYSFQMTDEYLKAIKTFDY